jgi:hypothetical protein
MIKVPSFFQLLTQVFYDPEHEITEIKTENIHIFISSLSEVICYNSRTSFPCESVKVKA